MSKEAVSPVQMRILCLSSQLNTVWPTSHHKERETITLNSQGGTYVREETRQCPFLAETSSFENRAGVPVEII